MLLFGSKAYRKLRRFYKSTSFKDWKHTGDNKYTYIPDPNIKLSVFILSGYIAFEIHGSMITLNRDEECALLALWKKKDKQMEEWTKAQKILASAVKVNKFFP